MSGPERRMSGPERVMVLRCPALHTTQVSADREAARLFERVVAAVTEFCPRVEVVEPGLCAFGARGPARYFGGETIVARKIIAAVADLGVECRAGVADGLFAALLAARLGDRGLGDGGLGAASPGAGGVASPDDAITFVAAGDTADFLGRQPVGALGDGALAGARADTADFLGRQPVGVLGDEDLAGLLTRLGIRTLRDLAALPAEDVASRFGGSGERGPARARGAPASRAAAGGRPVRDAGVRPAGAERGAAGVRREDAGRADAPEARRQGAVLRPAPGAAHLGRRPGKQQVVAARRAADGGAGSGPGPLAARRLACGRRRRYEPGRRQRAGRRRAAAV